MLSEYPPINSCIKRTAIDCIGIVKILALQHTDKDFNLYKVRVLFVNSKLKDAVKKGEILTDFLIELNSNNPEDVFVMWRGR